MIYFKKGDCSDDFDDDEKARLAQIEKDDKAADAKYRAKKAKSKSEREDLFKKHTEKKQKDSKGIL